MSDPFRRLLPNNLLYRKYNPEQFNPETGKVEPTSFEDQYDEQSFFVKIEGGTHPSSLLTTFSDRRWVKDLCGVERPSVEDMINAGFGVLVVTYQDILDLGLEVALTEDGSDYDERGHVNIREARLAGNKLAERAHILMRDEILSGSP